MKSDRFILFEYFKEQQQQKSPHPKDKNNNWLIEKVVKLKVPSIIFFNNYQ